jgi:hypothetical protein
MLLNSIPQWTVVCFINSILVGITQQAVILFMVIIRHRRAFGGCVYNDLGRRREVGLRTSDFWPRIMRSLGLSLTSIAVDIQLPTLF